jgi:hypothetical protein
VKKRKAQVELKRMNINMDSSLHDRFKAAVAARGKKMTDVLIAFIEDYVKHYPKGGR